MFPPMLPLPVVPPPILPLDVVPVFELVGVDVLIGVAVVFVVVFEVVFVVVLPALFVFSLAQPNPSTATASKVSRAKVLRIELSPVTQRVRF
jgi:hypothetical protein